LPSNFKISRSETPSMSSMTMAAPDGDSTYSYSRTTFGSSREAGALAFRIRVHDAIPWLLGDAAVLALAAVTATLRALTA
jgi:hypothetical protein